MTLDPRAKRFLDMMAASGPGDASRLSTAERREAFRSLMKFAGPAGPIGAVKDCVISQGPPPVRIRIYTPVDPADDPLPGLLFLHGGGWIAGGLDTHDVLCRALTNAAGCRTVAVDYPLAPEYPFPAAVSCAISAATWLFSNAEELGIDAQRIGIAGDSAGGTLAAAVCQALRPLGHRPVAQVLLCPIMDCYPATESRRSLDGYLLDNATMDRDLAQYVPAGVDRSDPRLSPLRAADLAGLPPTLIHTAEFDPLRDEGKAFATRLAEAGVKVQYTCHAGMIHLFYGLGAVIPYATKAVRLIGAEIRATLGRELESSNG